VSDTLYLTKIKIKDDNFPSMAPGKKYPKMIFTFQIAKNHK